MTPDQYSFAGNANTYIGAIALFATPVLLYWIFRSFFNSPYNVRVKTQTTNETPELYTENND